MGAEKPNHKPLTHQRIVQEAVKMADDVGVKGVSMRKLAAQLDVEAMSLYNHIANKDQLLSDMVDLVISEIPLPETGKDWRVEMRNRAQAARAAFIAHPWSLMLMVSRPNSGMAVLTYVEKTLACLVDAGFDLPAADHAWNAMDSHIYGFTLQELNFPFAPDEYAESASDHIDMIPVDIFPNLHGMATLVMQREYDGLHDFEFGLDLVLDGLEKLRTGAA